MIFNQSQIPKGYTNQILIQSTQKQTIYYIPAYLRLKIKNFTEMNLDTLDAQMNGTLVLTIFYGEMQQQIVQKLSSRIDIHFNRSQAVHLNNKNLQISYTINNYQKSFTYIVRKIFDLRIQSNIFWSPFEIINLMLTVTIQNVNIQFDKRKILIKFNLMDYHNNFLKIAYTQQGSFGNYDLAEALMIAQYSHSRISKQFKIQIQNKKSPLFLKKLLSKDVDHDSFYGLNQKSLLFSQSNLNQSQFDTTKIQQELFKKIFTKPKNFQYAHFTIPLYKIPATTIWTIFIPLWLLGTLNLGVFFQSQSLGDRIGSISAIMIAFVALIPIIRSHLPPSPTITIIQILLYSQILTCFLCLNQSMFVRNEIDFKEDWPNDVFFIISLVITILNILVVLILYLIHKFYWEPRYNRVLAQQEQSNFIFSQWYNQHCDSHFAMYRDKIQIYSSIPIQQPTDDPYILAKRARIINKHSVI